MNIYRYAISLILFAYRDRSRKKDTLSFQNVDLYLNSRQYNFILVGKLIVEF